ncbi:unnamed protein product, partial [Mesorhabditis spiculigera]
MGLLDGLLRGSLSKPLVANVHTMDADLESIQIEPDCTGRHLFDQVCRIIGLREIWFFGLEYTNKKGISCWLQMEKKISKQDIPRSTDGHVQLFFVVKFYPEDVEEELIQDLTRHLFFMQIKQSILSHKLYCTPEAAVLLASYAVQAMYGDWNETIEEQLDIKKQLPTDVISKYEMTADMWQEKIRRWWNGNSGMSREDAEMEYLRVAQDLEMYGIQYYAIYNKKETDLELGVSAQGIGIYKENNKVTPRPFFSWSEIKNISFKNKQFNMKTVDKSTISFQAKYHSINLSILDLCIGTHNLYLRRRQRDTLEVQQMKVQARDERIRKQEEQSRFQREKEERVQIENEKSGLQMRFETLEKQLQATKDHARTVDEQIELLASKAQHAEEELRAATKRAEEAELEAQRQRISHQKSEGMRRILEEQMKQKELVMSKLSQSIGELNRVQPLAEYPVLQDWNRYIGAGMPMSMSNHEIGMSSSSAGEDSIGRHRNDDIHRAQRSMSTQPVKLQYQPPVQMPISPSYTIYQKTPPIIQVGAMQMQPNQNMGLPPPDPTTIYPSPGLPNEIAQMRKNLEMSKSDYNERTRHFKETLEEFRSELEGLKREDRITEIDRAHFSKPGRDRGDTLRMSSTGPTRRRVDTFDDL